MLPRPAHDIVTPVPLVLCVSALQIAHRARFQKRRCSSIADTAPHAPPLEATVMYVAEKRDGKIRPLSHVLLECETNAVLADTQSVEALCVKIDAIRLANKA